MTHVQFSWPNTGLFVFFSQMISPSSRFVSSSVQILLSVFSTPAIFVAISGVPPRILFSLVRLPHNHISNIDVRFYEKNYLANQ